MKQVSLFLILCSCALFSFNTDNAADTFVGSTTYNPELRAALKIPDNTNCEFLKWEISLTKNQNGGTFTGTVSYGESQPNTNGFKRGFGTVELSGKFIVSQSTAANPKAKFYLLMSSALEGEIVLVVLNENVLHFADTSTKLLVGNGGFGCALNKINPQH